MTKAKPPSKKKGKTFAQDTLLPNKVLDARVKGSAQASVKEGTMDKYHKQIWTMKEWLRRRKEPLGPISDENLSRFLASHNGGITNGNSARHWRSAARKWRVIEGAAGSEALLDAQVQGIAYKNGQPDNVSADPIDSGRLGEMTRLLLKWGYVEYALNFVFIFYSMFRKVLGSNVLVSDVRFDTDVGTVIGSKRAKYASALKVEPEAIGNSPSLAE